MLSGSLADWFGRRKVFQISLGLFSAGSLLCSVAPSVGWLIAFRGLQAVAGLSGASGPVLGGLLVSGLGWRSIFWINVPVGLLAIMLVGSSCLNHGPTALDGWPLPAN